MHDPARPVLSTFTNLSAEWKPIGYALGLLGMAAPALPDLGKLIALLGAVGSILIGTGSILTARVNARRLAYERDARGRELAAAMLNIRGPINARDFYPPPPGPSRKPDRLS